jgi:RNase H-fold protein (predicted Holliday junction resolvase)
MSQTILAFDFGEKRIGVAVGNTITKTAEPLKVIPEKKEVVNNLKDIPIDNPLLGSRVYRNK